MGSYTSVKFTLNPGNPVVTLRIGGGSQAENYVAICNAETGEILAKISAPASGHVMHVVSITVDGYVEGTPVVVKVVDGTDGSAVTGGWGFLHVDDFRFSGYILEATNPDDDNNYSDVVWSFEDGYNPFTTDDNFTLPNICDDDMEWNEGILPMNKDGKYYMSTIGTKSSVNEAATGEFVSVPFILNPATPWVNFRIGGGGWAENYVSICNAETGEELARVINPINGHPLNQVVIAVPNYVEGTPLVIKIVDNTTENFAFIHVDDFRFSGTVIEIDNEETTEPKGEDTTEPTGEVTTETTGEGITEPKDEDTTEPTDEVTTEPTGEVTTEPKDEETTQAGGETTAPGDTDTDQTEEVSTENEGSGKDTPKKEHDHAMDDIRYFVLNVLNDASDGFFVFASDR
jgi:hypothetical protein